MASALPRRACGQPCPADAARARHLRPRGPWRGATTAFAPRSRVAGTALAAPCHAAPQFWPLSRSFCPRPRLLSGMFDVGRTEPGRLSTEGRVPRLPPLRGRVVLAGRGGGGRAGAQEQAPRGRDDAVAARLSQQGTARHQARHGWGAFIRGCRTHSHSPDLRNYSSWQIYGCHYLGPAGCIHAGSPGPALVRAASALPLSRRHVPPVCRPCAATDCRPAPEPARASAGLGFGSSRSVHAAKNSV